MAARAIGGTAVAGVVGGIIPIGGSTGGERITFTLGLVEECTSNTLGTSDVVVPDIAFVVLAESAVSGA